MDKIPQVVSFSHSPETDYELARETCVTSDGSVWKRFYDNEKWQPWTRILDIPPGLVQGGEPV